MCADRAPSGGAEPTFDVRRNLCWHPDCCDPSREDAARLGVEPKPAVFLTPDALCRHTEEKHGISREQLK